MSIARVLLPKVKTVHSFSDLQAFKEQLAILLLDGGFPDVVAGGHTAPSMVQRTEREQCARSTRDIFQDALQDVVRQRRGTVRNTRAEDERGWRALCLRRRCW